MACETIWNGFLEFIAEGGSGPVYLCGKGVTYAEMLRWVKGDEDRETALAVAETSGSRVMVKQILEELRRIGLVDIRRAYDDNGALKPIKDIPPDVASAIVSIETEELKVEDVLIGQVQKVKFSDKLRALELLGKNLQLFIDTSRVLHMGRVTLEDLLVQSIEPIKEVPLEIQGTAIEDAKESQRGLRDGSEASGSGQGGTDDGAKGSVV
jgi:hypothetical protein